MEKAEKVRENKLRRMATRQELTLQRSRSRDPHTLNYGLYLIVDPQRGMIVPGGEWLTLDQVEEWLNAGRKKMYPLEVVKHTEPMVRVKIPDGVGLTRNTLSSGTTLTRRRL